MAGDDREDVPEAVVANASTDGPGDLPGVGPWVGAWPRDAAYDPELLEHGDRRNVVDRYRYWRIEAIVADLDTRRHPLHVAIENWGHDFNIGSVIRTANAFNVAEVHIVGRRRWNRRGAMVTDRYLHVRHHADVAALVAWAAEADVPLIGIDNVPGAVPLETFALPESCCLVFGQESNGLSACRARRLRHGARHHPVRLHALDQRRSRGRHRHARLDPCPRGAFSAAAAMTPRRH